MLDTQRGDKSNERKSYCYWSRYGRALQAIRLQLAGCDVEVYEKNQTPGGKMSQIKAEGTILFDVGPTIVMMPDLYCESF